LPIALTSVAALALVPVSVLATEVLLSLAGPRRPAGADGERVRLAVIVPAHDEALGIALTIRSIRPQLARSDRLVVVADNCSDTTAAIAAAEGAEVIERTDPERRGKGFALDFAVRHVAADPPDVVVIIDADCRLAPGAIEALARCCARAHRPTQALYLMAAPADAGLKLRIAQFAWTLKNQVRPTGLQRLNLPCQLMGTGMAFPWQQIRSATLATGHIVEDLQLGIELACAGAPPVFCPQAFVMSDFPHASEGVRTQRARWEHGHLGVILSEGPGLMWRALVRRDVGLAALALDLCVPPLTLLSLAVLTLSLLSGLAYVLARVPGPLYVSSAAAALLLATILVAWVRYGRGIVSLGTLALAPLYVIWKIPMYVRFLVARQLQWVRSKRDRA
jgi:cellulose synthase/poly-beta-1,6-N-acetylglucosamine synthase-like glycosyltransferase